MTTAPDVRERRLDGFRAWWQELQEIDRAGRAELRRCGTITEVAMCPAFHAALRRVGIRGGERDVARAALIAGVLAHVESEPSDNQSLARQMATPAPSAEKALVSDSRFRQLLRAEDDDMDSFLRDLIRVVQQMRRVASVQRLAADLWWWNDRTRRQWALDYFQNAPEDRKR